MIQNSEKLTKNSADVLSRLNNYNDRIVARHELDAYLEYTSNRSWQYAEHLGLLCQKLQEVERGNLLRLMVFMPPRHGKSEVISRGFPPWFLGRNPKKDIILTSYSAELAHDFSRQGRNRMRDWSEEIFGYELAADSSKITEWRIAGYGGGMKAAGVEGSITGKGAHVAIIDDPIKNWADAQSKTKRDNVWSWYQSTLLTRLAPRGAIVLVMTRWHNDDLAGRLLDKQPGKWEVLKFPALAGEDDPLGRDPGEALWPSRYTRDMLLERKEAIGSVKWPPLYQQEPPEEAIGALWTKQMIETNRVSVENWRELNLDRIIVSIDPAGTKTEKSDETGIIVAGMKKIRHNASTERHFYVLEDKSDKYTPNEWATTAIRLYNNYQADKIIAETNNGGDTVEETIRNVDRSVPTGQVKATRNKKIRAEPISTLYERGIAHHVDIFEELEDQMTNWTPGDDSPDRLDAMVWAGHELGDTATPYRGGSPGTK